MFTVYVLKSQSSGKLYIGQTQDLERRIFEHQNGIARYTRNHGPWEVLFTEEYSTRVEAMRRETFLKSGKGREFIKAKLNGRAGPPEAD